MAKNKKGNREDQSEIPGTLTAKQVARRLNLSIVTIYRHLRDGPPPGTTDGDIRLVRHKRMGKKIIFSQASFVEFLEGRQK